MDLFCACDIYFTPQLDTLFLEDFGKLPSELFKHFDPRPVAAASLAQVFKAVTPDGERVAVKAQYIDLRDRYDGDMWTIQFLLKLVAWIHPKFKLSWIFHVSACVG
jgi:aarF domain-containing kinase